MFQLTSRCSRLLLCFLVCGYFGQSAFSVEPKNETEERMLHDMKYLSSDDLEGRGVKTEGLNLAAEFIRKEFEKAGLDVTQVDGGAFQKFPFFTGSQLGKTNAISLISPEGKTIELEYDEDFRTCSFGGSSAFETGIVFVGYGIDAKKKNYNDFAGVDVKGKIVILLRRVPGQGKTDSPFSVGHGQLAREASLTYKVSNAFRQGAKGVLFVNDVYTAKGEREKRIAAAIKALERAKTALEKVDQTQAEEVANANKNVAEAEARLLNARKGGPVDDLMKFGYGGNGTRKGTPIGHITQNVCSELLQAATGKSLEEIEKTIDATMKPQSVELKGWTIKGELSVDRVQKHVKNVIGVIEGEGPHKEETIVIGAHYDHVGRGGVGSLSPGSTDIHNGADDNASGTVTLIELARRLGSGPKPARRLVFIAFTAEERGLVGSAHYCKNPIFPLEKTVAMFNMDMVGRLRLNQLTIFGTGTSPRWTPSLDKLSQKHEMKIAMKPEGFGPSDHSSFYAKKIPVLHFFTGTHGDYHRPSDDWEKINYTGMTRILALVEDIVTETINTDEIPGYEEIKQRARIQRTGARPYFGSIPDFAGTEGEGYSISGVTPNSPAALGGLKAGDRIVKLGNHKIGSLDDFDLALRQFSAGEEVPVTVMRDGKEVPLKVKLTKPK